MNEPSPWLNEIERLVEAKGRYPAPAYLWILRVIDHARRRLERDGHISARELLEAHRELALETFGPMAFDVCQHWNFHRSEDVGEAVFDLVECGLLKKTADDDLSDFGGGYDFEDVFVRQLSW